MANQKVKGRAYTLKEKKAIVTRLLRVWERCDDIRFGQLLTNAATGSHGLFYKEDEELAKLVEDYGKRTL